jgi:4-hydroxy-tetrahydrodipicolinate synthase
MNTRDTIIHGACTELLVAYNPQGEIDFRLFEGEVDRQIESGIAALFCNGLATEALLTTHDEQIAMVKTVVNRVRGKVPVIGNIVTNVALDAIKLLRGYEDAGASAVCITQPMVYEYTPYGLYKYFSSIATRTVLPVYIYNAPESSNTMSPALVAKIVNDHDNVIGYKDSTKDIMHLQTVKMSIKPEKHFECVAGSDGTIFPTLAIGGAGVISLISAVFPKPVIECCEAYFKGNIEESYHLQEFILKIRIAMKAAPLFSAYKFASELLGYPIGGLRAPLIDATPEQKKVIQENLKALNLI